MHKTLVEETATRSSFKVPPFLGLLPHPFPLPCSALLLTIARLLQFPFKLK